MRKGVLFLAPVALTAAIIGIACSAQVRRSGFEAEKQGGDDGGFEGSQGFVPGQVPCEGLECKIVTDCAGGGKTTLTGKVYDPAGSNPLYNVMVYIPGGTKPEELPPMKDSLQEPDGISCETCASVVVNPLRSALTDGKGEFVLEDVPVDKDVPIVVQVGKWRRLTHVDITKKCEPNKAPDRDIRLPKSSDEGNLPQIAVTQGALDALECLLRGIGIDDKEFVQGDDPAGHVHVYTGYTSPKTGMGPAAQDFWNDSAQLKKYDLVLLSCEGSEHKEMKGGDVSGARASMYEYLNAGGKVFATHYHYVWFKESPEPEFKNIANWENGTFGGGPYDINQTFPKGEKFAEWLKAVGASPTQGKIALANETTSLSKVNDPAVAWITKTNGDAKYFSFNTPLTAAPENQCGRAVFSDLHMVPSDQAAPPSIGSCAIGPGGLNGQQKALEFLFYDLSACVTDDKIPPQPPK
jgi:hypothetical protein